MAKIITEEIYNKLKDKQTKLGVTLDKCIQTGMSHHEAGFIFHLVSLVIARNN